MLRWDYFSANRFETFVLDQFRLRCSVVKYRAEQRAPAGSSPERLLVGAAKPAPVSVPFYQLLPGLLPDALQPPASVVIPLPVTTVAMQHELLADSQPREEYLLRDGQSVNLNRSSPVLVPTGGQKSLFDAIITLDYVPHEEYRQPTPQRMILFVEARHSGRGASSSTTSQSEIDTCAQKLQAPSLDLLKGKRVAVMVSNRPITMANRLAAR
jgi:hypothetical protein